MGDEDDAAPRRAKLTLPHFKGDTNALEAIDFADKVDAYAEVMEINAGQAAKAVAFAVKQGSKAALWLRTLRIDEPNVANDWEQLKPRLLARFSPILTPSERAAVADNLKMTRDEEVQTFADRCREIQIMLERDIPEAERTGNNAAGFQRRHMEGIRDKFLYGLRETDGLKKAVNSALGCTTFEEYLAAAMKFERNTLAPKPSVVIAEVSNVDDEPRDDDTPQVAALKAAVRNASQRRGRGRGGQGGGARPGQGQQEDGAPRACWTCASTEHIQRFCPNRRAGGGRGGGGQGRGRGGGGPGGGRRPYQQQQQQAQPPLKWGVNEVSAQQLLDGIARLGQQQQQAVSVHALQQQQQQYPVQQQQSGVWAQQQPQAFQ
jgi:hypothetical protein